MDHVSWLLETMADMFLEDLPQSPGSLDLSLLVSSVIRPELFINIGQSLRQLQCMGRKLTIPNNLTIVGGWNGSPLRIRVLTVLQFLHGYQ